jgi:hypothetical protein
MLHHSAAGELRMCSFWAGGISSRPFSRAREHRLLRRLDFAVLEKQVILLAYKEGD